MKMISTVVVRLRNCLAALALCAAAACDPCAGTPSCRTADHVSYTGHVVDHATGHSVAGVSLTFVRTGGVQLAQDSVHALTGSDGFFTISVIAKAAGTVSGTLQVSPPGKPPYDISGVELQTTRTNGDGGDLGRIVVDPYIQFMAQIQDRVTHADTGAYASVTFTRTGGIDIQPSVISTTADAFGRFVLEPTVTQPGTVQGTLTISAPGFPRSFSRPISIDTRYQDGAVHDVSVVNLGAALLWVGEVYRRATNQHVAGIQVDFNQTGGIPVTPSQFTTTTNDIGLFPIQPDPLSEGELVGNITVHPPGGLTPFTVTGVRVHTTSDDSVRLAGRYGYGAQLYGLIELRYRTTMTAVNPGAVVTFHRTAGIQTVPDTFVDVVKQLGFAGFQLPANAPGDVTGDLVVQLGEPYGTDTIRSRHFTSAEDDTQRFGGTYLVGRWFPQIAQLVDSVTHKAIPGAKVTFTRVDGVDFSPNPYTVTPDSNGYFGLRPQPLADGDVVGNMTFVLPPPYANVTIQGIHLHTSMDDTLRFLGAWFIAPKH